MQATTLEVPITLAREEATLRFVEVHLRDLQTVLQSAATDDPQ
jgi:hypothetical protein